MGYRILVDENTSPRVAERLCENGHDAKHVTDALEASVNDRQIGNHARQRSYVVLTHDDDFLHPEHTRGVSVLYYSDDSMSTSEIVERVEEVSTYVPDPDDLPRITSLKNWE